MTRDTAPPHTPTQQRRARPARRARPGAWTSPTPPDRVVERPSRTRVVLVGALAAFVPAASRTRAPSVLEHALAAGPGSPQWLAVLGYEVLVVVWTALVLVRSVTTLTGAPGGPPVLEVRSAWRTRVTTLGDVRRVVLVTVAARGGTTSQRALLLDDGGRVVGAPAHSRGFWLREDTQALLRGAGIAVDWEHRRSDPRELEAAYPGSSLWTDRHPVLLTVLVVIGCLAGLMGLGWLLDA
ncbi:hypothetical protein [Cellulomonas pakistanensis]|uniref:PH domain-containing protein n=1 Tax=Cellulomonas pakistanensis TaxID=992287 RepID=A0A919U5I4_9CELL|nr:hypothetical protein [Cellulomonas pakistanensis]GIG35037.1 hypothetical protein Cpa01nite_04180 [Cellulomonas pakistanensis]